MSTSAFASDPQTIGARLVRLLRMRLPDDPAERRAQQAYALMQLTAGTATFLQLVAVAVGEGTDTHALRLRLFVNFLLSALMFTALFAFTRHGRLRASGTLVAVGVLVFIGLWALAFGMRNAPSPVIVSLTVIASLSLVETPRRLAVWTLIYGIMIVVGFFVEPRIEFTPSASSLITGLVFSLSFFAAFMIEHRVAMVEAIRAVRAQAATVASTNADLRRTIAERDLLSAQLATAQRLEAMGRMAGSIAHDFNNLLTVIRGYADLIADDMPADSPRRVEAEQMVQAVIRASNVTREVLDFASPHPITMQPTDLTAFLKELAPNLSRLLAPRVVLRVHYSESPCVIAGDRAQLERLLFNLIINARDVTPDGGVVQVELGRGESEVFCRVSDGGPGVPPELRDRIFEPFFTTKGTTGGTGLGLASSYAIARQHGGSISVDDATSGGAKFTVVLPAFVARDQELFPAPSEPIVTRHPGRPLDGMRALLVEDDDALRRLATRMLQRSGATVDAFDNGVDAVSHLESHAASPHAVHLIVTDLRLPRGSGADVIDAARRVTPGAALVAISGFLEDPVVAERAERLELFFLPKPFSERELLSAIDEARKYGARATH